ncbi:zinc finger BED domain-containing protein RICESLEEPER 2 [Tanacetum coccineum]
MKSKVIGYRFRHLIEYGCIPTEVDEESEETPIQFLTEEELCEKLVKKVEKDMRVLFAMYKEKYGTNILSDIPKSMSSQSTTTTRRRDILSIQVSTVAFESAFSASGRILDPYRNCLAPTIVEALICGRSVGGVMVASWVAGGVGDGGCDVRRWLMFVLMLGDVDAWKICCIDALDDTCTKGFSIGTILALSWKKSMGKKTHGEEEED